jgi:hypothetical protein
MQNHGLNPIVDPRGRGSTSGRRIALVFAQGFPGGADVFGVFDSLQQGQVGGRYQGGDRFPAAGKERCQKSVEGLAVSESPEVTG